MNLHELDRRTFLAASAASVPLISTFASAQTNPGAKRQAAQSFRPIVISSANGLPAITRAMELLREGVDPLDSVVAGINLVENDAEDMSVGLGGLPNEQGVVELDSSVMHGPTHKAGAVAALQNIKNPSSVALKVMRRTDHVLLVGQGALEFAKAHGFKEENLLTEKAREIWLKWKENLNAEDDWLNDEQQIKDPLPLRRRGQAAGPFGGEGAHPQKYARSSTLTPALSLGKGEGVSYTHGTIHCSAVNEKGDVAACTSTSGLSFKIPGRVGDSPIIGAGMFVDNDVGAAGATGRGEAVIQSCGSFQIVRHMADGLEPSEACLKVLKWIADHTKRHDLLDDRDRPNFGVTFYALRRDGVYGSATMHRGTDPDKPPQFAVHDGAGARREPCAWLFE